MTNRSISLRTALLFGLVAGCVGDAPPDPNGSLANACAGIPAWAQGTTYASGDLVTDTGDAFSARVGHTAFASNWNPKSAASLWLAVGDCGDGGGGGGDEQPPPDDDEEEVDEELPPPADGCDATGRPGPLFDPAGVPNIGNGNGEQFIGGQCLDASDCASGCCAKPCGICSGPGAQFQNGKLGCGFDD
jgi:hypothetical protein